MVDLPEVPGGYYISRNLDNAFRACVYKFSNPREMLSHWTYETNKEIALSLIHIWEERTVDGLQLFVSESAGAGISLPASALAAFSGDTPLKQADSGLGALPGNFRLASGGTPQSTCLLYTSPWASRRPACI